LLAGGLTTAELARLREVLIARGQRGGGTWRKIE
jgi:hypothetical protein